MSSSKSLTLGAFETRRHYVALQKMWLCCFSPWKREECARNCVSGGLRAVGLGGTRWSCAQALEMETSALLREGDCGAREHSHQRSLRGQRLPAQYPFKRPLDFGFPRSRSWGEHSDVSYFSGGKWKKTQWRSGEGSQGKNSSQKGRHPNPGIF